MKSGFIAVIGRTNVGKSSIINLIVGKKISIVSPKCQTTRDSIRGIYNDDDCQIVFVDTPGIHKPINELGEIMDKTAYRTIRDSDAAMFVVDGSKKFDEGDQFLFDHLKFDVPLVIVFNKIDLTKIEVISELKDIYKKQFPNAIIVESSAKDVFGIDTIIKELKNLISDGPKFYDNNVVTDRSVAFQIQEIIRENILKLTSKEVPHGVAVICNSVIDKSKEMSVDAQIICEKEGQKGILIGHGGKMIKKIGTSSRMQIGKYFGKYCELTLVVKVVEDWRNSSRYLVSIGYDS
ncbi:MAG: GTPase Era [Bacilli bacterium]